MVAVQTATRTITQDGFGPADRIFDNDAHGSRSGIQAKGEERIQDAGA